MRVVFRPKVWAYIVLQYMLLLLLFTFFLKRDFLHFFALLHTFSGTMAAGSRVATVGQLL